MMTENIIVGISIGDLNGIGSSLFLKLSSSRMLESLRLLFFANVKIMSFIKKEFRVSCSASWN
jgi:4-hydroxythreonine-4-phosphate dehydrogenase